MHYAYCIRPVLDLEIAEVQVEGVPGKQTGLVMAGKGIRLYAALSEPWGSMNSRERGGLYRRYFVQSLKAVWHEDKSREF